MKPTTKNILIGLSIVITVILIVLLISFVVIYAMNVVERNEDHKKLGHCVPLIDSAIKLENSFNSTHGFLEKPTEYKALADQCDKAISCVGVVDSHVSADILHTFSSCQFYVFYNQDFADCANKLFDKRNEEKACLHTLFNDFHGISTICGDDMTRRYEKEAANLRSSICIGSVEKD
ncbi:T20D4.11-like domain-containing protein [Caenorhabditis elegans]|uniref:T20D4.11-like domain-containing protein n=1 Tax=Caenorhabditis elegans TaxID=6239 RepID=A0A486WVM8_CAEEL|nr:DUF19 domain-containing protein [Caenorhabditis elegans]VGM69565.1 DUF19 domain-containing protein [Caenorhabditis elegans]